MSSSGMHMSLPRFESATTPVNSATKAAVKRKRGLSTTSDLGDGASVVETQSTRSTRPVAPAHMRSTSPTKVPVTYQPSEGLPTPLLSPADSKMEDFSRTQQDLQNSSANRVHRIRKVVQQQINLEILLKHNELRLIDQELAKCQTALEQLRRCKEIPWPMSRSSLAVSTGNGVAVRSSFSGRLPESPAAWGVTDGPYSRHYAHWLLPAAHFDGGEPEAQPTVLGKRPTKSRVVRASFADESQVGMSSRSQRAGKLKALPAGYGQPKEKAQGPLILKRKSDDVMVKLICPVCSRGDFGSAQGFINHCRIGHGRNFSSHDQAAEQCGEPVETDEHGAVVGQEFVFTPTISYVHPLIRTARLNESRHSPAPTPRVTGLDGTMDAHPCGQPLISPGFRASLQTPHLSDLVKNKGLGLNLQDMVTEAKVKVEFAEDEDEEIEDSLPVPSPENIQHRHPEVAGTRGVTKPRKSLAASPILQSRMPATGQGQSEAISPADHGNTTEPSPITESNQAPSLIDDDEDFGAHSPTSSSASEADEGDVQFTVRDDDDYNHEELSQSETQPSCTQAATPQSPRPARVRRPSALRSQESAHEPKHVTFVNENPGAPKAGGDKKRRKTNNS